MIINSGELKTQIIIIRPNIVKDEDGIPVESYQEIYKCKAKVTTIRGSEFNESKGDAGRVEKRCYFRKHPHFDVELTDAIILNGKTYNIIYVNDIEEQGRYYEVKMELCK